MDSIHVLLGVVIGLIGLATLRLGLKVIVICAGAAFCCRQQEDR